jgi:predicted RNA-binding protein associated with RNAse of E/G family
VVNRSIFRGRLTYAVPCWLLAESATHVVTATVPGAETIQLAGPRSEVLANLASGRGQTHRITWQWNRVVWMMPWSEAHSIGHFWNAATGEFRGWYINLQSPLQRSAYGFDSLDHVLDVVVEPGGDWHWKDEDELVQAVELGIFSTAEAAAIRAEGERVIANLPARLPTGWETWQPDPTWPALTLPPDIEPTTPSRPCRPLGGRRM